MATEPFKAGTAKLDEKLEGKNNFVSWKLRIERFLSIQESADPTYYYSRVIINARADLARPAANAHDDARGKYDRSVSRTTQFILASVSQEIFMQVYTINHPRDIMERLVARYKPSALDAIRIREELSSTKIAHNPAEYISKINSKIHLLRALEFNITEQEHKAYLLTGLDNRFVSTKMQAVLDDDLTVDTLETLIQEEAQMTPLPLPTTVQPEANYTKKRTLHCKFCPTMNNHDTKECRKICKNCDGRHWTKTCKSKKSKSAHITEEEEPEANFMFAIGESSDEWVVDSACNIHIAKRIEDITDAKPYTTRIKVGNGQYMLSTHKGKINLPTSDIKLKALLCPTATRPLISVHKLTKEKFTVILRETDGEIVRENESIKLLKKNGFWIFKEKESNLTVRANRNIIHRRLGHLSGENVNYLLDPENELLNDYKC